MAPRLPIKLTLELGAALPELEAMQPSISIERAFMPSFVEALKSCLVEAGFLSDVGPTQSELKATKYHLEDMRQLAFSYIQKDQKNGQKQKQKSKPDPEATSFKRNPGGEPRPFEPNF